MTLPADLGELLNGLIASRATDPVSLDFDPAEIAARVARFDFEAPADIREVSHEVAELLRECTVRCDSPRYFGLFNTPSLPAAIVGDCIAATLNPQLAVYGHAPAAAEIERRMIVELGSRVWPRVGQAALAGHFTSGGSEANATAVMAALARKFERWADEGLRAVQGTPKIYVSENSHLAWIKIARCAGLGAQSVRLVPTGDGLRMTGDDLREFLRTDAAEGDVPFLIVSTVGTAAHGSIDDTASLREVADDIGAYLHVDAAWAGALVMSNRYKSLLGGIDKADSVTIDPRKWLSVPMGTGVFLARDWDGLEKAFAVSTDYMPSASVEQRDTYIHFFQWSRRFIGIRLFMALATLRYQGYSDLVERAFDNCARLRSNLRDMGWETVNDTDLPVVCFAPPGCTDNQLSRLQQELSSSGNCWFSITRTRGRSTLRACITSYPTGHREVDVLCEDLASAWDWIG